MFSGLEDNKKKARKMIKIAKIYMVIPCLLCLFVILQNVSFVFALPVLQDGDVLEEPKDLNNWFGLYLLNMEKSVLVPVELTVKRYAALDEDKEDSTKWTGRTLLVNPKSPEKYGLNIDPNSVQLLLLLQSKDLVFGIVSTSFPGNGSFENRNIGEFANLREIGLGLGKETYRLSSEYNDCRIKLVRGEISAKGPSATYATQCIFTTPPSDLKLPCAYGWPSLVWAGDVDRDKKIDFIFDIDSDSTYARKLFLSKDAGKNTIVEEVGVFWRPSGC